MDPSSLAALLQDWGYPAFLALLCVTAFGSPIPEDLLLVCCGYLISAGIFSWPVALPIALIGVVASDFILYTFGRRIRAHTASGRVGQIVPAGRLERFAAWFDRVGAAAVFAARLVPGTRAVVFISAGIRGVSPAAFLAYDIAGALIWTPLLVWLGTVLGQEVGGLTELMGNITRLVFVLVIAAILLLLARRFWKAEEPKL